MGEMAEKRGRYALGNQLRGKGAPGDVAKRRVHVKSREVHMRAMYSANAPRSMKKTGDGGVVVWGYGDRMHRRPTPIVPKYYTLAPRGKYLAAIYQTYGLYRGRES